MDGIHDMGGMQGFGPVEREENEPVFHAPWERRMHGMYLLTLGTPLFMVDQARYAIERIPPATYLTASYYERWLMGLSTLLLESGIATPAELSGGESARPLDEPVQAIPPEVVPKIVSYSPEPETLQIPAGFRVGDEVLVRNLHCPGHSRVPGYTKGKRGTIELDHGVFYLPDTHAHGQGENRQHCYCVGFASKELWGDAGNAGESTYVDLWEDYLAPA